MRDRGAKQITKTKLLRRIADRTGLPRKEVVCVLDALADEIDVNTKYGVAVNVPRLGRFGCRADRIDPSRRVLTFREEKR